MNDNNKTELKPDIEEQLMDMEFQVMESHIIKKEIQDILNNIQIGLVTINQEKNIQKQINRYQIKNFVATNFVHL